MKRNIYKYPLKNTVGRAQEVTLPEDSKILAFRLQNVDQYPDIVSTPVSDWDAECDGVCGL